MLTRGITWAAALLALASGNLSAQERSSFPASSDSAAVEVWRRDLPADLVPPAPAAVHSSSILALQDGAPMVPVLFGIFGGIAGLFVADWWADRDCAGPCGEGKIAMLFLGGVLGAMIGWLIGGGEIPDPGPVMRGAP